MAAAATERRSPEQVNKQWKRAKMFCAQNKTKRSGLVLYVIIKKERRFLKKNANGGMGKIRTVYLCGEDSVGSLSLSLREWQRNGWLFIFVCLCIYFLEQWWLQRQDWMRQRMNWLLKLKKKKRGRCVVSTLTFAFYDFIGGWTSTSNSLFEF